MNDGKITILIPNFRTPVLTKLCLRSIRKYSDMNRVVVRVIDNGSGDQEESLQYLRSLKWIHLTENHPEKSTAPEVIHAQSLDTLLEQTDTEYVLSIHTDTIVLDSGWLDYVLEPFRKSGKVAGVGSWKLERHSPLKRLGKKIEDLFRIYILLPLKGEKDAVAGHGDNYKYLRSHCALFKTELLKTKTHGFYDGKTAGKALFKMLKDQGYEMVFLPENKLAEHIVHFDHATMVLNPEIGGRRTTKPKARHKLEIGMNDPRWQEILNDSSLDQ